MGFRVPVTFYSWYIFISWQVLSSSSPLYGSIRIVSAVNVEEDLVLPKCIDWLRPVPIKTSYSSYGFQN